MPTSSSPLARISSACAIALFAACAAPARPEPARAPQPSAAYVPVPYPPPPARVEFAPPAPRDGAIWLGGEWDYRFRRWIWTYGRWVMPPAGATYARWALQRDDKGELAFAPGAWRNAKGRPVESPAALATGRARESSVIEEDGTRQLVGPNHPPPPPTPAQ